MATRDDDARLWESRKAERARRMRVRKHAKRPAEELDLEQTLAGLGSPDEATRARAARQLCPCHTDWGVFEQNLDTLRRITKDSSTLVRTNALHVFEDAFEIEAGRSPPAAGPSVRRPVRRTIRPGRAAAGRRRAASRR